MEKTTVTEDASKAPEKNRRKKKAQADRETGSAGKKSSRIPVLLRMFIPKPGTDVLMTVLIFALVLFGSVMIVSSRLGSAMGSVSEVVREIVKQGMFAGASWVIYCIASWVNLVQMLSNKWVQRGVFVLYFALMVVTAVRGSAANGSKAWLTIGGISVQPSELGKPLLILLCVSSLIQARHHPARQKNLWTLYRVPLLMALVNLGFLILQKDIGSLVIFIGILLICVLMPAYPGLAKTQKFIRTALIAGGGALIILLYCTPLLETGLNKIGFTQHIAVRIENMKDPYLDVNNNGMQPANALYGLADAGLFGKGLGSSVRKYGFLTQAENDYIIAVIVEETGLLGLGAITAGYLIIVWRLIHYGLKSRSMADKVLFTASSAYLILHFFINIGGVSTLIPMTGVPLLFISAGGTSLVAICGTLGVCQHRIALINGRSKPKADPAGAPRRARKTEPAAVKRSAT